MPTDEPTTDDDLLTPSQAGELVGKSAETLRRWASEKRLRHVRTVSGRIMFRRADLDGVYEVVEPEPAEQAS